MNRYPVLHRLTGKIAPGLYRISHPPNCECSIIVSPPHALWVTYNQLRGTLRCNRCLTEHDLPCPIRRTWPMSKEGYMDLPAIQDELTRFAGYHENCKEPGPGLFDVPRGTEAPGGTAAETATIPPETASHPGT